VEALGLHKLQGKVLQDDTPTIRGMIASVQHLLSWREVDESEKA
jgi:ribosomal protein L30